MNPRDLGSLGERMDIGLVQASAAEVYQEQVAGHGARLAGHGPVEVSVVSDPAVPAGRYQLRQGRPLGAAPSGFQPSAPAGFESGFQPAVSGFQPPAPSNSDPAADWPFAHDGRTSSAPVSATDVTVGGGLATVAEPARSMTPTLRLITGGRVAETRLSGARAGRGAVELGLPDVPTVSREHARFTFSDGQWWVANLGMNGLTLNGVSVAGEQPLHDGDVIRWGTNEQAPGSRVEIG